MSLTTIAAVSAGTSQPSSTRMLADRLGDAVESALGDLDRPAVVQTVELRPLAREIADALVTGFPSPHLLEALETVMGADGVIVATPVLNASYSGLFKSFADLIEPDALAGTPVLLAATGGTARHSLVIEHALRPLFSYLRARTSATGVFAATADWGPSGDGDGLGERIGRAAGEFAALVAGTLPADTAAAPLIPFEQQLADVRAGRAHA